ncbi:MAG: hypothetical protein EAX95_16385 [Candidatus Thorarchaeota archaeon]|nr:hypothetical protein [Candidatus Thorarchaeota archaeon]
MRRLNSIIPLLLLFLVMATPAGFADISLQIAIEDKYTPSDVLVYDLYGNSMLLHEPRHGEHGDSGEFSTWHSETELHDDFGYVMLNWDHSYGVVLNNSWEYGEDYAFAAFDMTWNLEGLPRNAKAVIEYYVVSNSMGDGVNLDVWFVDSSGEKAYHSIAYAIGYEYRRWELHLPQYPGGLSRLWGGMIEDDSGYQEDPFDNFTMVVALRPSYTSFNPNCEGSVQVAIQSIQLEVVDTINPVIPVLDPGRQALWRTTTDNIVGEPEAFDADHMGDLARDLRIAPDGSIYGLIESKYYQPAFSDHYSTVVVKWNAELHPQWWYRLNESYGEAIAVTNDSAYVVGYTDLTANSDMFIAKFDSLGNLLWEKEYDYGQSERGEQVVLDASGYLYVLMASSDEVWYWGNVTLFKVDSAGAIVWERRLGEVGIRDLEIDPDLQVYTLDSSNLIAWDFDGSKAWNRTSFKEIELDSVGNIYARDVFASNITLAKMDSEGTGIWNISYHIHYPGPLGKTYMEVIYANALAVSDNGSFFILAYLDEYAKESRLLHFSTDDGTSFGSRMLTNTTNGDYASGELEIGPDGYLYWLHNLVTEENGRDVYLKCFAPAIASGLGIPIIPLELLVLGIGGAAFIAVAAILLRRNQDAGLKA